MGSHSTAPTTLMIHDTAADPCPELRTILRFVKVVKVILLIGVTRARAYVLICGNLHNLHTRV